MARFCGNCEAKLDDDAKVCGQCGIPIDRSQEKISELSVVDSEKKRN